MKKIQIEIIKGRKRDTATIEINRNAKTLCVVMKDGSISTRTAEDLYVCFGKIRGDFPDVIFLCKGAKINVHPSRMTSQMASGLVAYEVRIGCPAEEGDTVRIFDYEEHDLTNNIEDQKKFYNSWLMSLQANNAPSLKN